MLTLLNIKFSKIAAFQFSKIAAIEFSNISKRKMIKLYLASSLRYFAHCCLKFKHKTAIEKNNKANHLLLSYFSASFLTISRLPLSSYFSKDNTAIKIFLLRVKFSMLGSFWFGCEIYLLLPPRYPYSLLGLSYRCISE